MKKDDILRNSSIPLYQQIKHLLLEEITSGKLQPHAHIPSERELVEQLGVSRITVRQALTELVSQGYLYTTPSKGFFVAEPHRSYELNTLLSFTSIAQERGMVPTSKVLESKIITADISMAQQLFIPFGSEIYFLDRLRLLNGVAVMRCKSWLPYQKCPEILSRDFATESLYKVLSIDYSIKLTRSFTIVSARLAEKEEINLLELDSPGVVMTMDQRTFGNDDQIIELSMMSIHPQKFPLSLIHSDTAPIKMNR